MHKERDHESAPPQPRKKIRQTTLRDNSRLSGTNRPSVPSVTSDPSVARGSPRSSTADHGTASNALGSSQGTTDIVGPQAAKVTPGSSQSLDHREDPGSSGLQVDLHAQSDDDDGDESEPAGVDSHGRIRVRVVNNRLVPSGQCSRIICASFHERLDIEGARWKMVSQDTKEFYWGEFKKKCFWDDVSEDAIKSAYGMVASKRYSDFQNSLVEKAKNNKLPKYVPEEHWKRWCEIKDDPQLKKIREQNRVNRRSGAATDTPAPPTHTGGTMTFAEHTELLAKELQRPPMPFETFLRTHTSKGDGKTFVNSRAQELAARVTTMITEISQQSENNTVNEMQVYLDASGGVSKGHVYGLGSQASYYYPDASSSSASSSRPRAPHVQQLQHRLQETENELAAERQRNQERDRQIQEQDERIRAQDERIRSQEERYQSLEERVALLLSRRDRPQRPPPSNQMDDEFHDDYST